MVEIVVSLPFTAVWMSAIAEACAAVKPGTVTGPLLTVTLCESGLKFTPDLVGVMV